MARVPPFLRSAWARMRPRALGGMRRLIDSLRAPGDRAASPRTWRSWLRRRAPRPTSLRTEFEAPARSPWLARSELLALCTLALLAALDRRASSQPGVLAGFFVLAVALLTLATFRRHFLKEVEALLVKVLVLAREMKLLKLDHIALDGTKSDANQ